MLEKGRAISAGNGRIVAAQEELSIEKAKRSEIFCCRDMSQTDRSYRKNREKTPTRANMDAAVQEVPERGSG